MRRRFKQLAILSTGLCLVAVLFLGVSLLVPVPLRPSLLTRENFDRVERGMSEDEVEKILGPPGYYHSGHYTVGMTGMIFRRYWFGDEGVLSIVVGRDDPGPQEGTPSKVLSKRFKPVPRQSYGERWLQYYLGYHL